MKQSTTNGYSLVENWYSRLNRLNQSYLARPGPFFKKKNPVKNEILFGIKIIFQLKPLAILVDLMTFFHVIQTYFENNKLFQSHTQKKIRKNCEKRCYDECHNVETYEDFSFKNLIMQLLNRYPQSVNISSLYLLNLPRNNPSKSVTVGTSRPW